jgi:hypothetical protein
VSSQRIPYRQKVQCYPRQPLFRLERDICTCLSRLSPEPIKINLYVSDVSKAPEIVISQFTDDVAACTSSKYINYDIRNPQRYMSNLEPFLCKYRVKINADNCTTTIFSKSGQIPRNRLTFLDRQNT